MTSEWTLAELVERVAHALAASAVRAPNARVTDLPDARVIRWYRTIGLIDPPSGTRGRTALYGPRHLLQVLAVKRRQAAGATLAEIQQELAGATEATLRRVAAVGTDLLTTPPASASTGSGGDGASGHRQAPAGRGSGPGAASGPVRPSGRFWARPAAASPVDAPASPGSRDTDQASGGESGAGLVYGVRLGPDVTLLLPAVPDADALAGIRLAAAPLLDLLADHGLDQPTRRLEGETA
ncbi:MAG TPA: MerR family transcriptional regulator [Micromonosporaceae bacterium]